MRHVGALQPTNPALLTLFNRFPWGKGSGNMVGSWDLSGHGSGAQPERIEHEYAGSVLSLAIQKHLLCWTQWMPKFVIHFYSTLNTDAFLLAPLEKGYSREVTRQIHGKKVNWDSKTQSCSIDMGTVPPCPFSGLSCSLLSSW